MVTMDGRQYRVRVKIKTLRRSFRIEEDDRSSMVKSGAYFRSIIGTYYDYAMEVEPDPAAPEEYDDFFEAISAPVESHSITVPYGQSTLTFDAYVANVDDELMRVQEDRNLWGKFAFTFTAMEPQRRPA